MNPSAELYFLHLFIYSWVTRIPHPPSKNLLGHMHLLPYADRKQKEVNFLSLRASRIQKQETQWWITTSQCLHKRASGGHPYIRFLLDYYLWEKPWRLWVGEQGQVTLAVCFTSLVTCSPHARRALCVRWWGESFYSSTLKAHCEGLGRLCWQK